MDFNKSEEELRILTDTYHVELMDDALGSMSPYLSSEILRDISWVSLTEEQLAYKIHNNEISANNAIKLTIDLGAYSLFFDIVNNLEMSKKDREYLIANFDKVTSAIIVGPLLALLEDEDEFEHFLYAVLDRGYDKAFVGMAMVNKKVNRNLWRPVIKVMAGRSSEYIFMMGMLLEKMHDLTEEEFMFFYTATSSKDFANLIADKGFHLSDNVMKMVFVVAKDLMSNDPMTEQNPPAAGLLLNTIDINMSNKNYSFKDEFDAYMYEYTGKEEYLPEDVKDIFIF